MSFFNHNSKKQAESTFFAFNANDDGLCVFDENSKVTQANEAAATMFGYNSAAALAGGNILNIIQLTIRDDAKIAPGKQVLETAIKSKTAFSSRDYLVTSENGKNPTPIELSLIPQQSAQGIAFLLKMHNITKDLERESIQADFVSLASHEMRTPIAAIEGYLSLALNPSFTNIDAGARGCIESAYRSTQYLGRLFGNLLDVTRMDEEKYQPEFLNVEVNHFAQQLSSTYEMLAQNNKRTFSLTTSQDDCYVRVDPTLLEESITNLVDNAFKYTKENGEVALTIRNDANSVFIDVSDNGIGISQENLANIFDKFYRVKSGTTAVRGAGLGLYLTKKRLSKINGKISVTSIAGQGSTFTLSLPRLSEAEITNSPNSPNVKSKTKPGITPLTQAEFAAADPFYENMKKVLRFPKAMPEISAFPFIELAEKWKSGEIPSSTPEEKQKVYKILRDFNKDVSDEQFNKVWNQIEGRFDNPGLTKITSHIKSSFEVPWLLISPKAPSWEIAFGWGYDFNGNWREIPQNDYMYLVVLHDPEFMWCRERAILVRREIADKEKVLFLNAGCLPELRYLSNFGSPKETWACDERKDVDPNNIFGWISASHNVHYTNANIFEYLDNAGREHMLFDTVVMNGSTIGYYTEIERIIESVVKLLKPGGKFLFDIQVPHWDFLRANIVFGIYPEKASLPLSFDEAVSNVQKICSKIWNISVDYVADSRSKEPAGIMFCITNNGNTDAQPEQSV